MIKKKKGSTIILVLVIGLATTAILGTLMTSAVFTSKLNIFEKNDDDLLYAAEGALEKGISKLENTNTTSVNLPESVDELKGEVVDKAEFEIEDKGNGTFKVTGRAYDKENNKRAVSVIVKKNNNSNVLDYALNATGNIVMQYENRIDLKDICINAPGTVDLKPNNGSRLPNRIDENVFELPKFKFGKETSGKLVFDNHGEEYTINNTSNKLTISNLDNGGTPTSGATKFGIDEYVVYLFNLDKLTIANHGKTHFKKYIIINTGDIDIELNGSFPISFSSIFGKNINLLGNGQFSVSGIPDLDEEKLIYLENTVNKYTDTNWKLTPSSGDSNGSNVTFEKEEITYE